MSRALDVHAPSSVADSPEGVAFLTALLVRYCEIGSARLHQLGHQLRIDFYLHRQIEPQEWAEFEERLTLSWRVFFQLQRLVPSLHTVQHGQAPFQELPFFVDEEGWVEVETLTVTRDLYSLTLEELALVVSLVREYFEDALALNDEGPNEDLDQQDEAMHRCLERVRTTPGEATLTGFRDDMRVLIYSSQEDC